MRLRNSSMTGSCRHQAFKSRCDGRAKAEVLTMKPGAVAVAIVVAICASVSAQNPSQAKPPISRDAAPQAPAQPAGTGGIAGTLVASDSGRPVRRAQITITGGDTRMSKSATTDERGNFAFTALPAG